MFEGIKKIEAVVLNITLRNFAKIMVARNARIKNYNYSLQQPRRSLLFLDIFIHFNHAL